MGDQQGAALIIIMTVILLGGLSLALDALLIKSKRLRGDQVSNVTLIHAKRALIAYAAMHAAKTPPPAKAYGKLPCPYEGFYRNTADPLDDYGENALEGACSSTLGFLPWKTLGLPPLVDGEQAPIWYALSSRFSTGYPTKADFLCDQADLTIIGDPEPYAAILFSPGKALTNQVRASDVTAVNLIPEFLEGANADLDESYDKSGGVINSSFNDRLLGIKCSEILNVLTQL
ncbi:MAG: hypothetical protein H7829_02740 [Magnetococcus sp. THC-1_WYH]